MRAIGYFKPINEINSTKDMDELFSDYCSRYLHQPVKIFGENGQEDSGQVTAYAEMLDYMKESQSNFLIVVPDANHLGDSLESVARTMVQLEDIGSKVTCADDDMPDPLQRALQLMGPSGVSMERSERIKEAMRGRALQGKGLGKPPFGYHNGEDGTLEIVKDEASVIELIYKLYTGDGIGLRLIAQHLNGRGIPTRRGGNWNMVTIRDILKNSTYMGTYTRFGMRLPKSHEAIIPPKLFRQAQDETRSRRPIGRVVNAEPFLLSGMVYCGYCDNKMMGVTRRQTWRKKDGRRANGVYRYYQCQSRNNQSVCAYHTWRASLLEGTVVNQLKYALEAKLSSNGHNGSTNGRKQEVETIWKAKVKNAERQFVQAMKRTAKGEMDMEFLGDYLDKLDKARRGAENSQHPKNVEETFRDWQTLDFENQQDFLFEHIAKIVVKDDFAEVLV